MVYNWLDIIQFKLLAPKCILCGATGTDNQDLCSGCRGELQPNPSPCPVCAAPLSVLPQSDLPCGECQQSEEVLDHSLAPFLFSYPLSLLIGRFKFHGQLFCGRLLSQLLGDHIEQQQVQWPELIIPVPLHADRLKERGFNQAQELARLLGKRFSIPLDFQSVRRNRATHQQAQLPRSKRVKNIRGAFDITRPIQAKHVVLVDDVITTGSTIRELARSLKKAGVTRVDCWAVARTPKI